MLSGKGSTGSFSFRWNGGGIKILHRSPRSKPWAHWRNAELVLFRLEVS